jgi:hypothetical protein
MRRTRTWLYAFGGLCAVFLSVSPASAQKTTTSEVRRFQVVSVDGNKVVVKGQRGSQEITVTDDFRFTVNGKKISVHELKPGMRGSATITTTTTVTPVHTTEVRNAEVVQASANSIIVRGAKGFQMYSEGEVEKRGIKIYKNGRPVAFSDLHAGDKLTATIVTEGPPKVVTRREVQARLNNPPPPPSRAPAAAPPASATPSDAAASPAGAASSAPATSVPAAGEKQGTGTLWLIVGGLAAAVLALVVIMAAVRRRAL